MTTFTSKILKFELISLFTLTILSFIAFYFEDVLPDNYLSISSSSDLSFISYYAMSFIANIGFYTGPWVFIPFVLYSCFYTMQFSKRDVVFDVFNVLFLFTGCLFVCFFFFPSFVGDGVGYLIKSTFTNFTALFIGLLCLIIFFAGSLRSTFKDISVGFFVFLGKLPGLTISCFSYLNPARLVVFYRNTKLKLNSLFDLKLPHFLRGRNEKKSAISKVLDKAKVTRSLLSHSGQEKAKDSKDQSQQAYTPVIDTSSKSCSSTDEDIQTASINVVPEAMTLEQEKIREAAIIKTQRMSKMADNDQNYYDLVTALGSARKESINQDLDDQYFADIIQKIESKLAEFNIEGNIINVLKGPVVDTFELELGSGVKVTKILNSEADLSVALLGASIRIVYPMIGRHTVGIEVPRNPREVIYLDEVLNTKEFGETKKSLPIAMGKNAFGETFVVDLAKMPHMLVAGATGAGKSVFINALLVSLLIKKSPSQMKLILIDPKQLELALYKNLPHLVMPVITDAKRASVSLLWACQEMERRYSILKEMGVRDIDKFNDKLKRATPEQLANIHQYYENEADDYYELPYLVIIVDEFADLILTKAGKEIEHNICRLAAKARAAGIHLVLATQRPSVDVITGLIKSNFPTRVSFKVTSQIDSRTILNSIGAEKLLGKGDMLYRHGTDNLRVHSSFVDEAEIEALTDKLTNIPQEFNDNIMDFLENGGEEEVDPYSPGSHLAQADTSGGSSDDLYKEALKICIEHRTASASMLQRRLRVGYNRAANLIEEMEAKGIVGPAEGSKRRKVLVGLEALE